MKPQKVTSQISCKYISNILQSDHRQPNEKLVVLKTARIHRVWVRLSQSGIELPANHREGVSEHDIEGMSPSDAVRRYGESYYQNVLESQPGRLGAYERLSEGGGREEFARDYGRYVLSPEEMRDEDPELYAFMRDRIFRGREYEVEEVTGASSDDPSFGGGCNKLDVVAVDKVSFTGSIEDAERIDALRDEVQELAKKYEKADEYVIDRQKYLEYCLKRNNNVGTAKIELQYAQNRREDVKRDLDRAKKRLQDALS